MKEAVARRTGSALMWRGIQQIGIQTIYLVRTLVLARLLLPEHFGLIAIATTTVGIALNVSNLGMIPALVQRRDADESHYDTAWTVGVTRALVITALMVIAAPLFAAAFEEPRATNVIRALALRPLFEALASIQIAGLTRDLRFRELAAIRIPPAVVDLGLAIGLASTLGVWAMVVGTLGGAVTVVVLSYFVAPHRPRLTIDREAAAGLIRFGRWIFVEGLLAVAGGALIQLVISRTAGVTALGLYALAGKLAFLPYLLVSQVVGSVAFPLYARLQDDGHAVADAFRGLLIGAASLLVPTYCLLIFLAPDLVEHVLGPRWAGTGPIIQVLAVVGLLELFGDSVRPLLQGLGQPRAAVTVEALQTLVIVVSVQPLAFRYGAIGAAGAWIPAVAVAQLLSAYFVWKLLPTPYVGLARPLLAVLTASAAAGAVAYGLADVLPNALGPIVAGCVGAISAWAILLQLDRWFGTGVRASIEKLFPQLAKPAR